MELSANAKKVFDLIKDLSAVELSLLVKSLEEEFWVTAAAVVVAWSNSPDDEVVSAKDSFDIELVEVGQQKIAVIKAVKELMGVSLPDAKNLVEKAPCIIKADVKSEEAELFKVKLEDAWASVVFK